jgi:NifU-like protein involved in Fe-S cluster formation
VGRQWLLLLAGCRLCCFSQAAASMLAEYALGKTVAEMKAFAPHEMFDLFQADVPMKREGCILVSLKALHNLLETF